MKMVFYDLNLDYSSCPEIATLISHAASLGYSGVALTYKTTSDEFCLPQSKTDKKKSRDAPNPIIIPEKCSSITTLEGKPLQIYRRLSVTIQDSRAFHEFANNPWCKSFDIISVAPSDEKQLQQVLDDPYVDIVELHLGTKKRWGVKRKHARQAEASGKFFEVSYGDVLLDPSVRITFMSSCRRLVSDLCPGDRGRIPSSVMLSSGLGDYGLLRAPREAGYLAELFGFSESYAGEMNQKTANDALNAALSKRRTAKGCLQVIFPS